MDTSKVSLGEMIAGISALALFIFMFLPWYGIESVGGIDVGSFGDANANAWEAFSFIDILLLVAIIIVGGLVLASAADATPDLPESPATIIAITGAVAVILILFRLIFTPDVDTGGFEVDVDLGRKIGIFLGLIAAAGIAYGGYRAREEVAAAGPGTSGSTAPQPPAPAAPSTPPPPADPPPAASTPPAGGAAPPADPPPAAPSQPSAPGGDQPPSGGQSQY